MRDAGCSPLHQLLDDRASRAERVDPVAGDVRAVRRDSRGRYGARKIKAASLSSAKTVPHVPDSMVVAEMMLRLS